MRTTYAIVLSAFLAAPAMAQVIIQTPNPDASFHEQRAAQDRAAARAEHQEARERAAVGDYQGAAEAQRDARRDWHAANRQDEHAERDSSGAVIIGR